MSAPLMPLAESLTALVNSSFDSGEMLSKVSPMTLELLTFWFDPAYIDQRPINFHEGQRQAILNTIYSHEILGVTSVRDMYMKVDFSLILEDDVGVEYIGNERYNFPRYCMKMATGKGKTWVLDALLVWQYLNARTGDPRFSKNFLIVAPGVIVYERLLDSVLGKKIFSDIPEDDKDSRDFTTSDYFSYKDLFIPDNKREEIFRFLNTSVVEKEDIGRKITGDGQIIITNWHIFLEREEEETLTGDGEQDVWTDTVSIARSFLPIVPGISAGNSLEVLDKRGVGGARYEYLKSIKDLIVFNDEAHHLGENDSKGDREDDKKWQLSLNDIALGKRFFMQIDFSATPYIQKGKNKKYFPHIIVDFPLLTAIKKGLVKTLVLDQRKEIATLKDLEYAALRDESGKVIGLSEGQRVMISAGISKLRILESEFRKIDPSKYPKMLIVCEDTMVIPYVRDFLKDKGYEEGEDFIEVHSNKKGEIGEDEWKTLKRRLFALDKNTKPKIIISVLMLREGFDVNNVCVIVPLRSSASSILLEQTIGRGLRLMWRGTDYEEMKKENRENLLIHKKNPLNYLDILSVIEHPAYRAFYDELLEGNIGVDDGDIEGGGSILGDLVNVECKSDFQSYDIVFPIIVQDTGEILSDPDYQIHNLSPYMIGFHEIKKLLPTAERFVSETVASGTRFGDYDVEEGIMSAKSYNDYITKLIARIKKTTNTNSDINRRGFGGNNFPAMQANMPKLASTIDRYLKTRLWKQEIDYMIDSNWRILMLEDVASFIIKEVIRLIYDAQYTESTGEVEIIERRLSEISSIKIRTSHEILVSKCIYPKLSYPSNRGGLEKALIEYMDHDGTIEAFCKIQEYKHDFLQFHYIRSDGIPALYSPDFIVRTGDTIYLIETKATRDMHDENVRRKEKSALFALDRINTLGPEHRSHRKWEYILLSEERFYRYRDNGANITEMCASVKIMDYSGKLF